MKQACDIRDDDIYKFSNDPPTYKHTDSESSERAIYTCEECDTRHKAWKPEECIECGSTDLKWSYAYGYPGRFA